MPTPFALKKAKILSQLSTPSSSYTDASPKGTVDAPIRALVSEINLIPSLVTTSSCSGRIAIYAAGPTTTKGGGSWLFVSHAPLPHALPADLASLLRCASNEIPFVPTTTTSSSAGSSFPPSARLLHLKFEPLILHVLCADLAAAKRLLGAAQAAGFRESGVASLPAVPEDTAGASDGEERKYPRRVRKGQRQGDGGVMVAVRTMGLGMDAPVGVVTDTGVEMVVSEGYVASLVGVANERFGVNEERKGRLREGIMRAFGVKAEGDAEEDGERRREGALD